MNNKSQTLFHFTKSKDILKLIIKYGFWPKYCLEDVRWLGSEQHNFIAYPMACFCDIPISRVDEHVSFYGEYGIGLTKEWAKKNKFTPVIYIESNSEIPSAFRIIGGASLKTIYKYGENGEKTENEEIVEIVEDAGISINNFRYLLAHSKPTEGNMAVGSDIIKKEFYQESEWRYVPKHDGIDNYLKMIDFENENVLSKNNGLTKKYCTVKFAPNDIKYIFVKNDSDIPDIINFIQTELDTFPNADLKILMSRVTSLESIRRDI